MTSNFAFSPSFGLESGTYLAPLTNFILFLLVLVEIGGAALGLLDSDEREGLLLLELEELELPLLLELLQESSTFC